LNNYRSKYESSTERFRRWSGNAVLAAVGLGAMFVIVKAAKMASKNAD
jgi:hypothetical protein